MPHHTQSFFVTYLSLPPLRVTYLLLLGRATCYLRLSGVVLQAVAQKLLSSSDLKYRLVHLSLKKLTAPPLPPPPCFLRADSSRHYAIHDDVEKIKKMITRRCVERIYIVRVPNYRTQNNYRTRVEFRIWLFSKRTIRTDKWMHFSKFPSDKK